MKGKLLSRVWLLATPWSAAHQVPPSMGFSRQEYWSGVPSPSLNHVATEVEITGLLKWMGLYKALGVAPNFRSHKIWVSICRLFKRIEVLTFLYIVYTTAHRNMFFSICFFMLYIQAATAKSLQSCPTLCDPIDGSPPGSPVPGVLQARTLEWVAISFSNASKWKVKVKSLSRADPQRPHGLQPTRLLHP